MLLWTAALAAGCAAPGPGKPVALVNDVGTGTFLHPIQRPETVTYPPSCRERPELCRKDHVYIFGVNGLNPLCVGNFNGLLAYFREQGFEHSYFAQLYTSIGIGDEIRKIRRADPDAKIVLMGFSAGCNVAKLIANGLREDDTRVDLLVYVVGDMIWDTPGSSPPNVGRVVNIRAKGLVLTGGDWGLNGADLTGARNHKLECRHILTPSRRETLALMMEELLALACKPPAGPAGAPR